MPVVRSRCRSSTTGRITSFKSSERFCTESARTASSLRRDYAVWTPRSLVEAFVDFQIPEEPGEYLPITTEQVPTRSSPTTCGT